MVLINAYDLHDDLSCAGWDLYDLCDAALATYPYRVRSVRYNIQHTTLVLITGSAGSGRDIYD